MVDYRYLSGEEIRGSDVVRLADGSLGLVCIAGARRSLVGFRDTVAECEQWEWLENDKLILDHTPKFIVGL